MLSRFSSMARWRWNGPSSPEAGANRFASSKSKIATARSCSISGLRRTTVRSSSVMPAIRPSPWGSPMAVGSCPGREPDRQRQRMGFQPFRVGKTDHSWRKRCQTRGLAAYERAALEEVENAEAGCETRAARRRQYMVGPGDIIANGLWGMAAEEDRAGVVNTLGQRIGLLERELEVLRSDPVDQRHRRLDLPRKGGIVGDEDRLRRAVVLCLRHQIGSDPLRIVVPVGDDENLGRTGDHVDPDAAEDAPLRGGNIRITWPDDFVDRRNRRRAEREGGDRLRPADAVYLVDPDQLGGSENQRVDDAPGRRHSHH